MHPGASRHVNLLIIGAAKCGTTTLHRHLAALPGAYFSPLKEPNFHARADIDPARFSASFRANHRDDLAAWLDGPRPPRAIGFVRELADYDRLFEAADPARHAVIGEASTTTLWAPTALASVQALHPSARILVALRHPAERMRSHWGMARKYGFTLDDFRTAVERDMAAADPGWGQTELFYELGCYARQLAPWLAAWPADRIRVVLTEELSDPATWAGLADWVGLEAPKGWAEQAAAPGARANVGGRARFERLNVWLTRSGWKGRLAAAVPRGMKARLKRGFYADGAAPDWSAGDREWAVLRYADEVRELERLLGRTLPDWKR